MRLGGRAIKLNPLGLRGLNARWVFWGIGQTRTQAGFDGARMKTTPGDLTCGVDRRRVAPKKIICRSGLFRFFAIELDGVVGEDTELAVLVEGVQDKPLYTGFDEGP